MPMGKMSRDKGARRERELVSRHKALGIHAVRVPLSGAAGGRDSVAVDVYGFGHDNAALVGELKARANGEGFKQLETWLSDNDLLFLWRDRADPMAVIPWRTWELILERLK